MAKTWSDQRLTAHKLAQGHLSSAGATLGIAALSAAGLKSGVARGGAVRAARVANRTFSPNAGAKILRARQKAAGAATGLSIGSAGVGGIAGYNSAALQRQDVKRIKMSKSLSVAASSPFALVAKSDWKNISEHQTRIQRANRTRRRGAVVAGTGLTVASLGASRVKPGQLSEARRFIGNTHRSNKFTKTSFTQSARNLGEAAHTVARKRPALAVAATGLGAAGIGAGVNVAGSARRRHHENAIARQRKARAISKREMTGREKVVRNAAVLGGAGAIGAGVPLALRGGGKLAAGRYLVKQAKKTGYVANQAQHQAVNRYGAKNAGMLGGGIGITAGGITASTLSDKHVARVKRAPVAKVLRVSAFGRAAEKVVKPPSLPGTRLTQGGTRGNRIPTFSKPPSTPGAPKPGTGFSFKPSGPATTGTTSRLANRGRKQIGGGSPSGGALALRPTGGTVGALPRPGFKSPRAPAATSNTFRRNAAIGAGAVGAAGAGTAYGVRRKQVAKAFDSERSRQKRLTAYQHGAEAGAGAALGATGYALRGQAKQTKTLATAVQRTRKAGAGAGNRYLRPVRSTAVRNAAGHIARTSAKPLAIGLGTAGALTAGSKAIGSYRHKGGRAYRPLPLS